MRLEQLPIWSRGGGTQGGREGSRPGAERSPAPGSPVLRRIWKSTRGQWRRFALLALAVWSLYALVLSPQGWLRRTALERQVEHREAACTALRGTCDSLDLVIAHLDLGDGYMLEQRAREEFGFVRPNERVYRLPDDREDDRCVGDAAAHGGETFSERELRLARLGR